LLFQEANHSPGAHQAFPTSPQVEPSHRIHGLVPVVKPELHSGDSYMKNCRTLSVKAEIGGSRIRLDFNAETQICASDSIVHFEKRNG
jgi:hypothetical protein